MFCYEISLKNTLHWPFSCHSWTYVRADSRFAPSQWETALLCNDVSHWLGANLESALYVCQTWSSLCLLMAQHLMMLGHQQTQWWLQKKQTLSTKISSAEMILNDTLLLRNSYKNIWLLRETNPRAIVTACWWQKWDFPTKNEVISRVFYGWVVRNSSQFSHHLQFLSVKGMPFQITHGV